MNFKQAALFGSYISKDYAEDLLRLLATYNTISASEAASRLEMHIKTIQDFLEAMYALGFLDRVEVYEKKRPYFRYSLKVKKISIALDIEPLLPMESWQDQTSLRIREKKNANARFTTARSDQVISNITIWSGQGRNRTERKISLSIPQGKFLYHLPFPGAGFQSVKEIMRKAGVDQTHTSEVIDIVDALGKLQVVEKEDEETRKIH